MKHPSLVSVAWRAICRAIDIKKNPRWCLPLPPPEVSFFRGHEDTTSAASDQNRPSTDPRPRIHLVLFPLAQDSPTSSNPSAEHPSGAFRRESSPKQPPDPSAIYVARLVSFYTHAAEPCWARHRESKGKPPPQRSISRPVHPTDTPDTATLRHSHFHQ